MELVEKERDAMPVILILGLAFAIMAIIVALQNAVVVEITFLAWSAQASLALVVLVSFGIGIVAAVLFGLPGLVRRIKENRVRERRMQELEQEVARLAEAARVSAGWAAVKPSAQAAPGSSQPGASAPVGQEGARKVDPPAVSKGSAEASGEKKPPG